MSKVLCVFPDDRTTRFLDKIVRRIGRLLGHDFHCFKIKPRQESHENCLNRVQTGVEELIIFLGHGKSTELWGADMRNSVFGGTSQIADERFIYKDNISVFSGKKVFCLSCRSNENISKWAIDSGSITFLGFGDIPTDWIEKEYMIASVRKTDIYIFRKIITLIVIQALLISIEKKHTFKQLESLIKILTNKWMYNRYYVYKKSIKSIQWVDKNMYNFKEEIIVRGDKTAKLINY